MKERPILLGDSWVRLVLAGQKTQTRRPFKPGQFECPFAAVGDRLWVREAFRELRRGEFIDNRLPRDAWPAGARGRNGIAYRADSNADAERCRIELGYKWKPSIHMPRWACRLFLDAIDIRLEPVAAISQEDALAEGVRSPRVFARCWDMIYGDSRSAVCWAISFRSLFEALP
jgi:hypothetical protein